MKVLCVIYGIGRGVGTSLPSISKMLLHPMEALGVDLDVVYVLNEVRVINNPRSGEAGEVPQVSSGVIPGAELVRLSKRDLLDAQLLECVKKVEDVHRDGFKTYENLLCQLGMLKHATRIRNFREFDRVLMMRDDLFIESSRVEVQDLLKISEFGMITTMWHWHGGVGERFVLSTPQVALILSHRVDQVAQFACRNNYINGEHLQRFVAAAAGINVLAFDLRLTRVRLHEKVKENFLIPFWRPFELIRILFAVCKFSRLKYKLNTQEFR